MIDPRPDIRGDSKLWNRKLETAYWIDGTEPRGMFAILHGVRCLGATLEVTDDGYRIEPPEDMTPEEWAEIRSTWLKPHATSISNLLRRPDGKAVEGCRADHSEAARREADAGAIADSDRAAGCAAQLAFS